jgi:Ca-activated chloride channel family protein
VSPLAALAAALLAGASPFVAEQPRVKEGNEKLLSGDAAAALERYDAAAREAGPRPEIEFDRGNALHALGRHAEAREAWRKALEADQGGALSSRSLQNMANALDAEGDQAGAARALGEALRRDPANEDARYNLEVLLRRKASGKGKPQDEGQDGAKQQQGPQDQGQGQQPKPDQQQQAPQQGQPPPEPGPAGPPERRQGEQPREQGKKGDEQRAGERQPDQAGEHGAARPDAIGRQEAEKLLDAMRSRERNMPLGPPGKKDARPREVARDW